MKTFLAGLAGLGVGCALTWVTITSPQTPTIPPSHSVQVFNDGFTASKEDDCDQGFAAACEWVAVVNAAR
ncbi:hypothetical protein [Streptomyces parvus]|uniref:hypothetical protein n=1 Tax=Streptomyces parvus TaxID=66428 RepID=UPI003D72588E